MKHYQLIIKQVFVGVALSWLLYNEYRKGNLTEPEEMTVAPVSKENATKAFVYPPLPKPYPSKILPTPKYDHPFILVGGHPRSGTTLMRSMLDAHDMVRCGEETHILPMLAQSWDPTGLGEKLMKSYAEVGLTEEVLNRAVGNFLMTIIVEHGSKAQRLCNKDPFTMMHAVYINKLFPNAKFVFMVRDGRATIHSAITRNVGIKGYNLRSYEQCLRAWNQGVKKMYKECEQLGPKRCHPVFYEELILNPRDVMKNVMKFLELPWRGEVLRHEDFINKEGGISLNPKEASTDQVSKARYEDALTSWVGKIPAHLLKDMKKIAPMLKVFGYDPSANPPSYDKLRYRWHQKLSEACLNRTPYRTFVSALYHKTNDTEVKKKGE